MGLDYSYVLIFKRQDLWRLLEGVAELSSPNGESTSIFFPNRILELPFEAWSETPDKLFFDDTPDRIEFMTCLDFHPDEALIDYASRNLLPPDNQPDGIEPISIGIIYLTVFNNPADLYDHADDNLIVLRFQAATSNMSILFCESSSINAAMVQLLDKHEGICGILDFEDSAQLIWWRGQEATVELPHAYLELSEIEALLPLADEPDAKLPASGRFCIRCTKEFTPDHPDDTLCPECRGDEQRVPAPSKGTPTLTQLDPELANPPQIAYCIIHGGEFTPTSPDEVICPQCREKVESAPMPGNGKHKQKAHQKPEPASIRGAWPPGYELLDTYTVCCLLGVGGMGSVYRVHHKYWNIDLAVKSPLGFETPKQQEVFINEAETWIELGLHPNIVTCYYVRNIDNIPRVFAELVEGGSLADWIEEGKITTLEQALDIAIQIAWGLAYSHEKGLIHRDVKPANILMTPDGVAKVTDFGLAKAGKGMTPAYASPEQVEAQRENIQLTPRSDVWSWGLAVLEVLAGRAFWVKPNLPDYAWGQLAPQSLEHYLSGSLMNPAISKIPAKFTDLLKQCFEKTPSARPSQLEIADRLAAVYQSETGEPYPRKIPKEAEQRADSQNNKALSLLDLGRESDAIKSWEDALRSNPSHLEANYNLGYWEWIHGKREDLGFLQIIEELDTLYSDQPSYWLALAKLNLERGDLERADLYQQKASKLGGELLSVQAACDVSPQQVIQSPIGLYCLRLSPNGRFLLTSGLDKTIRLYDLSTQTIAQTYRSEHNKGEIYTVGVPPKWHLVLCGSYGETIELWETSSGKNLGYIKDESIQFSSATSLSVLEFTPDGLTFFTAVREHFGMIDMQAIHIWDIRTGKLLGAFEGHTHSVYSLVVTPDGRLAISSGWTNRGENIKVWEIATKRCVRMLQGQAGQVYCLAVSPDGNYLLSGNENGSIGYWDLRACQLIRNFSGHNATVQSVAFDPNGEYALSGGEDRTVRFWDLNSGKCLRTLTDHTNTVHAVLFTPDGSHIYSAGKDGAIRYYSTRLSAKRCCDFLVSTPVAAEKIIDRQDQFAAMLKQADDHLQAGRLSTAYRLLRQAQAVPGYEKASPILDRLHQAAHGARRGGLVGAWLAQTMTGHSDAINHVNISRDGRLAVSASSDCSVRLWELRTGNCIAQFKGHQRPVFAVEFSPNDECLVTASKSYFLSSKDADQFLRLWQVKGAKQIHNFKKFEGGVSALTFSQDGVKLFVANTESIADKGATFIQVLDVRSGGHLQSLSGHSDVVTCMAVFGGGRFLLSGSRDATLKVWNVRNGECLKTLQGHQGSVHALAILNDGQYALSGGVDNLLRLWDLNSGACVRELKGHSDTIHSIAATADGRFALSGGEEFSLRLWDVQSGRVLQELDGHTDGVTSVVFSGDGRYALSGSFDKTLKVWEFDWEWLYD